jgi:hypothetical protein
MKMNVLESAWLKSNKAAGKVEKALIQMDAAAKVLASANTDEEIAEGLTETVVAQGAMISALVDALKEASK